MRPQPASIIAIVAVAVLVNGAAAQAMSSPTFDNDCVVTLTAVDLHTSPSYQSLTAVGVVASSQMTSGSFAMVLDPLCAIEDPCPVTLCGDCNLDGVLSILDALTAAQHAVAAVTLVGTAFNNCDIDSDADVDVLDSLKLAQKAAGLPVALTCC